MAALTIATLAPLILWDVRPALFPKRAHDPLAALPLALIAFACVIHAVARRASAADKTKAAALAAAFLFWAANQLWPQHPLATLFNDIAIALFVLDVFFAIVGWPSSKPASARRTDRPNSAV